MRKSATADLRAARIVASGGRQRVPVIAFVPGRPFKLVYCEDAWGNVLEIMSHSYAEVFATGHSPA